MRSILARFRRPYIAGLSEQLMLMNSTGDGSTLTLDFTTGVLDPRLTFTRSSTGTFINASGLVATASNNVARFDYDLTTQTPRGLLIEGAATNLAFYSEYINPNSAPWNVYWFVAGAGASVTPVSQADPAGGTTASRCILGTSGSGRVYNGISTTAGVTYTLSFWARSVSGTTSLAFWHFNSATGNSTAVTIGTSWQRYQVTILGRTGGGFVECGIANLTTNAATIDLWGLQFETGSGASSYIPTGASQGTRARDECSITGGSFSSWFTNPNEGSFFVQYSMNYPSASMGAGIDRYAFEISDSAGSSRALCIAAYRNAPAGRNVRVFNPSGASFDSGDTLTTSSDLNTKFAFGYATADNYIAAVGVAQAFQTYNAGSLPTSPAINQMWLGTNRNLSSTTYLFGCIRTIKYWPTRLPNATLQGLVS